jgi:hypothetical protein
MKTVSSADFKQHYDDLRRIGALMQRGIQTDRVTGKAYYTGYSYNTLYDWDQAVRLVNDHLMNPKEFWRAFPIPSYAATEPGYREERLPEDVGCNWRAQTWIPINYYLMHGLMDYGYTDIAGQIAEKSYDMVKAIGDREYYNTDSCTGNGLDPFWGWSLLAYFMLLECETCYDPTALRLTVWDALMGSNHQLNGRSILLERQTVSLWLPFANELYYNH